MDDVTVVGAGVIGLSCAVRLLEAGYRVTVRSADLPEATVSAVAAAVWYPSGMADGDERLLTWAEGGYRQLEQDASNGAPGVVMRHTRMLLRRPKPAPWWSPAVPDFRVQEAGSTVPGVEREWLFTVPTVEMSRYLEWLVNRVKQAGGSFERRPVGTLDELQTPFVVNASGLAARTLADDPAVHPVRGQLVLVSNPGLVTSVRDEGNPGGSTYIHPRRDDVVLGGTSEPHQSDLTPDPATTAAILARCRSLVPELAEARTLRSAVGLRPGRVGGVRLEVVGGRIVHNYGHGGGGVTLAWGCADETLRLVQAG